MPGTPARVVFQGTAFAKTPDELTFAGDVLFAGVHGRLKTADVDALIARHMEIEAEVAATRERLKRELSAALSAH